MAKRTSTTTTRKTTKKPQAKGGKNTAAKKTAKKAVTTTRQKKEYGLNPGITLIRKYKGVDLKVQVTEDGFGFKGKTFKSISAVARHIVGYTISGPVFFGLTESDSKEAKQ